MISCDVLLWIKCEQKKIYKKRKPLHVACSGIYMKKISMRKNLSTQKLFRYDDIINLKYEKIMSAI